MTMDAPEEANSLLAHMKILKLEEDERCMCLARMRKFYTCTQHSGATLTWDGRSRDPGVGYLAERLRPLGFMPMAQAINDAPLAQRHPDAPVPLAKRIISQFTDMLLGEGMQPTIRCRQDDKTEMYMQAVFKEAHIWDTINEARGMAGSCGAAVIVSAVIEDKPFVEVLAPENCWVPEWDDKKRGWVPKTIVHQVLVAKTIPNEDGKLECKQFWQTRAWTDKHLIVWEEVEKGEEVPKEGIPVAAGYPIKHGLGQCPVVWYQNIRSTGSPDGEADCDGVWPLLDKVDRLNSQAAKACISNADPTVVIKDTERKLKRGGHIGKGSGNVIAVSADGDAKYLEVMGDSIEAAFNGVKELTQQVLQTARCVEATPEIIKSNESGEARQMLWRSMESRANRLRVGLESAVISLANLWRVIGSKVKLKLPDQELKADDGTSQWQKPKLPEDSKADFTIEFPPYWEPTATQVESFMRGVNIAAGGQAVISIDTGARLISKLMGVDPDQEVQKLGFEKEQLRQEMVQDLKMKANLPNGPRPDQPGEPSAGNKPKPADKNLVASKV